MSKNTRVAANSIIAIATIIIVVIVLDRAVHLYQINSTLFTIGTLLSYLGFAYLVIEKKKPIGVLFILLPFAYLGGTILYVILKYNPAFSVISGELMGLSIITFYPLIMWGVVQLRYKLAIISFYFFSAFYFTLSYMEHRLILFAVTNITWVLIIVVLTLILVMKNKNYGRNNARFDAIVQEMYGDILDDIYIKKEDGIVKIRGLSEQMLVEITDDGELTYFMHFNTGLIKRIVYNKRTRNVSSLGPEQNSIFKNYVDIFTGKKGIVVAPDLMKMRFRNEISYKTLMASLNYKNRMKNYNAQLTAAIKLTKIL